jgi:Fe2+ transport system protein FeoA
MADMGMIRGTPVEVVKVAPLGDPIEIKVRGYNLSLRKDEAAAITVELP